MNGQEPGFLLSLHARQRLQQRGISMDKLDLVSSHGEEYFAGRGSRALWLSKKACRTSGYRGEADLAVIISEDNEVITVMHCIRVLRHWKRAA